MSMNIMSTYTLLLASRCSFGLLGLLVNREEMLFNLFENGGIVVDHTTVETHLNWCVGHQQVFPFRAIEVFDPPFLILVAIDPQEMN
jgi:hypothetical protein